MSLPEIVMWIDKLRNRVKVNKKMKLKKNKRNEEQHRENVQEIPEDWKNTLVRNYPSLQRNTSTTSTSSSTTLSSSSMSSPRSSSYSVSDFLRDLANSESLMDKSNSKTSTPFTCSIVPMNRMTSESNNNYSSSCSSSRSSSSSLDISGLKIYEENQELSDQQNIVINCSPLMEVDENNFYENGVFLRQQEADLENIFNAEDLDDGYEIIIVNNNSNKHNFRSLKCHKRS